MRTKRQTPNVSRAIKSLKTAAPNAKVSTTASESVKSQTGKRTSYSVPRCQSHQRSLLVGTKQSPASCWVPTHWLPRWLKFQWTSSLKASHFPTVRSSWAHRSLKTTCRLIPSRTGICQILWCLYSETTFSMMAPKQTSALRTCTRARMTILGRDRWSWSRWKDSMWRRIFTRMWIARISRMLWTTCAGMEPTTRSQGLTIP